MAFAAIAVCAIVATPGCGIGDRQRQADLITAARRHTMEAGFASALVHLDSLPKTTSTALRETTDGGVAEEFGGARPAGLDLQVSFDFAHRRTGVTVQSASSAPDAEAPAVDAPTVVFEDDTAFAQRANRRAAEHRVWASLDFGRLNNDERSPDQSDFTPAERLQTLATSLNPHFVLDLMAGTLAGSVERVGAATIDGVSVTHYRANISLEMASSELDLSDEDLETRERVFRLVGVGRDVNPAEYWITVDGTVRRARFEFDRRLFDGVHDAVTMTFDLDHVGGEGPAVTAPAADQTIRLQRYARFVRSAVARGAA